MFTAGRLLPWSSPPGAHLGDNLFYDAGGIKQTTYVIL